MIKIRCYHCEQKLDVTDMAAFSQVNCPLCATTLTVPREFGAVSLIARVGEGMLTEVYQAIDPALDREVAVKVFLAPLVEEDATLAAAFRDRAKQAAAAPTHPGIATTFSCGEHDERPFLTMPFYKNGTVHSKIPPVPALFSSPQLYAWLCSAAQALQHLHTNHLAHGDLRPRNFLLDDDDELKLADAGLLQAVWDVEGYNILTLEKDRFQGASPELLAHQGASPAGDIFSLGHHFYVLFTGASPYGGVDIQSRLAAIRDTKRPEPFRLRKDMDRKLSELISAMLSPSPDDRPAIAEIAKAAEEARNSNPTANSTEAYIRDQAQAPATKNSKARPTQKIATAKRSVTPAPDTIPEPDSGQKSTVPFLIAGAALLITILVLWLAGII